MIEAQRLLASNSETAPEILRELGQSDDRVIRQAIAGESQRADRCALEPNA